MSTIVEKPTFFSRLSHVIVSGRKIILLLCIAVLAFCVIAMPWVEVDNSFTSYLDAESETRKGIAITSYPRHSEPLPNSPTARSGSRSGNSDSSMGMPCCS